MIGPDLSSGNFRKVAAVTEAKDIIADGIDEAQRLDSCQGMCVI